MIPYSFRKLTKEFATRKKVSEYSHMMGILPDPNKILADNSYDYEIFRDLLTDPHLSAAVQQRKLQVMQMNIQLHGDTFQKERAKEVIRRLRIQKIISESMDALLYGFSPLEVNYSFQNDELVITDVNQKPQEWFIFDDTNEIFLRQKIDGSYIYEKGRKLPEYKFIIVRNEPSYNNPYGEKLLANCYWPVTFKRAALEYWQDRVEKYGLPFIEGEYPSTASDPDIAEFEAKLEEMLDTNLLVKKEGYSLNFREPPKYDLGKVFEIIINFHNKETSKAMLGETLTIEMTGTGSYKIADIHREILGMLGMADKKLCEMTLDRLLQYDMFLNFGELEAARVKLKRTEDIKDLSELIEIVG